MEMPLSVTISRKDVGLKDIIFQTLKHSTEAAKS